MKRDDELNAMVAERVMGWVSAGDCWAERGWHKDHTKIRKKKSSVDFCNSWTAMGEVIEKMKSDGFNSVLYFRDDGKNACMFTKEEQIDISEKWSEYSAPRAVALAAIKACGEK